jgi:hypothetical protein
MTGDRFIRVYIQDGKTESSIVAKFNFHDGYLFGVVQHLYISQSSQYLIPTREH